MWQLGSVKHTVLGQTKQMCCKIFTDKQDRAEIGQETFATSKVLRFVYIYTCAVLAEGSS